MSWSSSHPLNFRPEPMTALMLVLGLSLFGVGEALMIAANFGVSPWIVLAEGAANRIGISIGLTTFLISLSVLLLWIPLRQTPGLGTVANAVIIALMIDLSLPWLPQPSAILWRGVESIMGIFLIGFGSGLYLMAHLGPGPRDGLMTGIQRVTRYPIARVRTAIEMAVVLLGWLLGGTVGFGTVLFAFGIGPAVAMSLFILEAASPAASAIDE